MSIAALDPLIHPPKRLAAMAILAASDWADFTFLRARLDASDSDLSKQMKVLQDAGYAPERGTAAVVMSNTARSVDRLGFRLVDTMPDPKHHT